jgi:TRAP-type C4-dicarboxylate transport system substrate-binding protein
MQFGAVSVNIPAAERYEAMQRGTIDGGALPAFSFVQYKAIEVSKYFYLPPFGNGSSQVYINHSVWKGLSPPLQDAVYWSCRELGFSYYKQYKENLDDPALEEIQKKIHLLTFPEAEVQKLRSAAMKSWNKAAVKSEGCQRVYDLLLEYGREKKYLK